MISWSEQSRKDLRAIRDYIARDSDHYAQLQVLRIIERVEKAATQPMKGHPVHEHPETALREVHCGNYRIIHRIDKDQLGVVTIIHMKQRLRRGRLGGA